MPFETKTEMIKFFQSLKIYTSLEKRDELGFDYPPDLDFLDALLCTNCSDFTSDKYLKRLLKTKTDLPRTTVEMYKSVESNLNFINEFDERSSEQETIDSEIKYLQKKLTFLERDNFFSMLKLVNLKEERNQNNNLHFIEREIFKSCLAYVAMTINKVYRQGSLFAVVCTDEVAFCVTAEELDKMLVIRSKHKNALKYLKPTFNGTEEQLVSCHHCFSLVPITEIIYCQGTYKVKLIPQASKVFLKTKNKLIFVDATLFKERQAEALFEMISQENDKCNRSYCKWCVNIDTLKECNCCKVSL